MSRVLHRTFSPELPRAVRGEGPFLFDQQGRRYLDASGGAAVSCLGHGHPRIVKAIVEQAETLAFAHSGFFTTEPLDRLADFLVDRAPAGISRAGLVCGGSEANEAALKLVRQYWVEKGQPSRSVVIARRLSYHGNTLGALSVSGHQERRAPYAPYLFDDAAFISPCYEYRGRQAGETAEAYGLRVANELEEEVVRIGTDRVSAFIAETVVGAAAGCVPAVRGYFKRIREICDKYEILFICDEVMCGMGRTGTLFAIEQDGVAPDVISVAKGLGGGYQPVGAVLVSEKIVDVIRKGTGTIAHGHTYMGHALGCAAALAVQETIEEEGLLEKVRRMGTVLESRLREAFAGHPHVGDIRGRGLFWAVEFVADRESKRPFEVSARVGPKIKEAAMQNGLICYPSSGSRDGACGDHVIVAPPYIVGEPELDEIARILRSTVDGVLG